MSATLLQAVVRAADARTPDADLLGRFAAARDAAAFEELVRRHGPLVWAVCRQLLPHHHDAEDAFQAVFLALARGAASIRAGKALPAWLHGVAVRVAVKARRAAVRRRQREEKAAVPEADRPVPDAAWAALMAAVHEEVSRLPDPERTAFVLCDLEGVRQSDAAARLGWPLGTLSGRLCKARQRLLDLLTRRGVAPSLLAVGGLASSAGRLPATLIDKVITFPVAAAAGVSTTVAELARGLTEGVTMRTKLTAAAFLVAGALGLTGGAMILSTADAQTKAPPGVGAPGGGPPAGTPGVRDPFVGGSGGQPPGVGAPPPGMGGGAGIGGAPGMGMPGMGGGGMAMAAHSAVEHKFIEIELTDRAAFEKAITAAGKDGWEFAGSERFEKQEWNSGTGARAVGQIVLVFKRAKGGTGFGGATGGGAPAGMGGIGGSGGGRTGGGGGKAADNQFQVFALRNVAADDVVTALQKAFPAANLRAVAERQSNSVVIISADPKVMQDIARMIEQIDNKPVPPKPIPMGGATPGVPMGGGGSGMRPGGPMGGLFGGMGMGPPDGAGAKAGELRVVTLKHATANEMADVLERVFGSKVDVTPEARTNQLVIRTDLNSFVEVVQLLEKLDVQAPKR